MKKVLLATITLTAIGVAVRAYAEFTKTVDKVNSLQSIVSQLVTGTIKIR